MLKRLRSPWFWGMLLSVLFLQSVPLMLCMPLTADPALYDLQAKCALEGGVLYRDIVEPNLPGIVWLHMIIRSVFGWSVTALRIVDLAVVAAIVLLLTSWHREQSSRQSHNLSHSESLFLSLCLFWFYFGASEWCHCQRDTWMLLPALGALLLRRQQISRLTISYSKKTIFLWGCLEGILWAIGFWIKPFIAIPALVVLSVSVLIAYKSTAAVKGKLFRKVVIDFSGVLAGGAVIGALGIFWLIQTGTWDHFLVMFLEWNPAYLAASSDRWSLARLFREQLRFLPFSLFHLLAIPLAIRLVCKTAISSANFAQQEITNLLLAALYLGWMLQSFTMQHLFDYVHVPEILLGVTLVIRNARKMIERICLAQQNELANLQIGSVCLTASLLFLTTAVLTNPATSWQRTSYWSQCISQGSTPEVRSGLQHFPMPNWVELEPALNYLRELNLQDGQLTVHNVHLVHAYRELNLKPSTRFVYLDVLTRIFYRNHQEEIIHDLDHCGHQYVLSGLIENGMLVSEIQSESNQISTTLPTSFPEKNKGEFPYHLPVVFRSGQYTIHRVDKSVKPLNPAFLPLAKK